MNPISPTSAPQAAHRNHVKLFVGRTALIFAAAAAIAGGVAGLRADSAATPAAATKGEGLDALDDRALGAELSGRGIANLLDHYFKAANIPESDRRAIATVGALSELRKVGSTISYGEKLRRVREVADGIDAVLPTFKDPRDMMQTAETIKEFGLNQDVNSLEYWGEDPVTQTHLKPLSTAVIKLYAAASAAAAKQADDLQKGGNMANQAVADKWEALDGMSKGADYNKNMSVYFDCIATSPKVMVDVKTKKVLTPQDVAAAKKMDVVSQRKSMANDAIIALTEFDNPDNQVQARIRTMIAKLDMAAGEFTKARQTFATVYAEPTEIKPPPNPLEQNEARYFAIVTELLAGDLTSATADKAALDTFTLKIPDLLKNPQYNMPAAAIAEYMKGISAAGQMLQWRIYVLAGDLAKDNPTAKKKADADAEAVLLKLRESRPELAARIDQQLVNRMPADKVIDNSVPPSLLLALLKKGMNESYKADTDKPDEVILKKGIEAALAIVNRKDPLLTQQNVSEAKLAIANLQQRLGNDVDATNAYLDFAVEYFKLEPKKATEALDTAGYLVLNKMNKLLSKPKGYEAAYSRFLPIAIGAPFNHKELAFLYAEQLREGRDFDLAIKYYRDVPKDDHFYGSAQYKIMLALDAELDPDQNPKKIEAADKARITADLVAAATEIKKLGVNPKDNVERSRAIAATRILAEMAVNAKDSKRIVEVLQGFDQLVDGLTAVGKSAKEQAALIQSKNEMKRGAKIVVVRAEMQSGKIDDAVKEVMQLVAGATDMDGMSLVRELLEKLDEDYNRARDANDTPGMREARKNEASLTGYLVEWANPKTQTNPKVVDFYYAYAVYDARMLREAGALTDNPEEKKKLLIKSRDGYQYLQTKLKDRYLAQPDVKQKIADGTIDPADPDWQVAIGLAFTTFDLGDYKTAREQLLSLVQQKKLGAPDILVMGDNGQPKLDADGKPISKPNDLYWEGTFKYLWSGYEINKNDPKAVADVARDLKNLLIRGVALRWAPEFERLRKLIAPDFNPDVATTPAKPVTPPRTPTTQAHK